MTTHAIQSDGLIGASQPRTDGEHLLTGRVRYVDDIVLPGMLHLFVVRSPVARARIVDVDVDEARQAPGVVAAFAGKEAAQHAGPIPYFIDPVARGGVNTHIRCLATGAVVHAGQPLAAVVARTRHEAEAAGALVKLTLDSMPPVLDAQEALRPESPRVYEDWADNVVLHQRYGQGDVDAALARADVVIEETLTIARQTTSPIEPRGYIASWDRVDEVLTVHGSCQNPHQLRWMLSVSLGMQENQIRIVTAKIGGSFGLKMQGHPEETLVALASRLTGAPVKWIEDRRETLMAGARQQVHHLSVGATADGRLVALRDHIVADCGALSAQPGWAMPNMSATTLPSCYRLLDVDVDLHIVATNKPPLNAARGFGKDAAHFVMERAVDMVAKRLGMDPVEVRRINIIRADEFPFRTATGLNVDSGDYEGLLDKVLAAVDVDSVRAKQRHGRALGRYVGLGLAFELTPESADGPGSLVSGFDVTTVRMDMTGTVTVLTGVTSPGGGNDTGIAQVVARELGVPIGSIRMVQGDTGQCPAGFGNFSGRSMVVGGGSAALAARDVRGRLLIVGARMLTALADDVEVADGFVRVCSEPDRRLTVADVAEAILTRAFAVADDIEPVLESTRAYKPGNIDHKPDAQGRIQPYPTYSSCLHAAVVEVDAETGVVRFLDYVLAHDCGVMINPALVEGQAYGAVVMGIGGALTEALRFDDEGRLLTDRFKTYLLPRSADVPHVRMVHQVTPSPFTMYGNKGAGEAGVGGAQAAVANAVEDALAPFGVEVREVPLTPPVVLRLLREAGHR